jgi:putative endonuclease
MNQYYTYILTNKRKTVLYVGIANNLEIRLQQHRENALFLKTSFTGKYNCIYLLYYELYYNVRDAIAREKEIKGWTRQKKIDLIKTTNPQMVFLTV